MLQELRSTTPPAWFQPVHARTQGFCPAMHVQLMVKVSAYPRHTHTHPADTVVKAHTWHSLESHIHIDLQVPWTPAQDTLPTWSPCVDLGFYGHWLLWSEVCWWITHTTRTQFQENAGTGSLSSCNQAHRKCPQVHSSCQHWKSHSPYSCWSSPVAVPFGTLLFSPTPLVRGRDLTSTAAAETPLAPVADTTSACIECPSNWHLVFAGRVG